VKLIVVFICLFVTVSAFSQTQEEIAGILIADLNKATHYFENKKADSALFYGKRVLEAARHNGIDSLQIKSLLLLSKFEEEYATSLDLLAEAEQLALQGFHLSLLARTYYQRGELHYQNDNNKIAYSSFLKSDSLALKYAVDPTVFALTKDRLIGLLFRINNWADAGHFPQIEEHVAQGLKICDSFNLKAAAARLHLQRAVMHKLQGGYNEAPVHYQKALQLAKEAKEHRTTAVIYNDLGSLYFFMNKLDSADVNYQRAIEENKKHSDSMHIAKMNVQMANYYNMTKRPTRAIGHLKIAEEIYDRSDDLRLEDHVKINDVATNIYFQLRQLDSAFAKSKEANRLFVEMTKVKNEENIAELEAKYDNVNKQNEIELLKALNKLSEEQKRNQRNVLIGALAITLLGLGLLYLLYRNRQKTNQNLKELDQFRTQLFTNISHEFRTPLTLISGPIEQLLQSDLSEEKKEELSLMQRNSKRLVTLTNQILDLAKLESGKLQLKVTQGDLSLLIAQIIRSFSFQLDEKKIKMVTKIDEMTHVWFDKEVVEKITSNLVSNAIKYTPHTGKIVLEALLKEGHMVMSVLNDGNTLSDDDMPRLFERYHQDDVSADGFGIGLSLVKELALLSHGNVIGHVIDEEEIQFTVTLPVQNSFFSPSEISQQDFPSEEKQKEKINLKDIAVGDTLVEAEAPLLLIIDDEPEIRAFVASIFKSDYRILLTENGKKGIDAAIEYSPDVVISDVMMPEANGLEVARTLKLDERTSHIPIILLTAKADEQFEIEGLKTGVDDYIPKPFSVEKLKIKVRNLLSSRQLLRDRYAKDFKIDASTVSISSAEDEFMKRLKDVLDESLTEPDFGAKQLVRHMLMSRMQLHRKLKALFGHSASEFIRTQRLAMAADLLKNSEINISQIGYSVGFNDHAYFSKSFKAQYQCTPSQYARKSP